MKLVFFESLQFDDAEEQVVLLVAQGWRQGPSQGFLLHTVHDASELEDGHMLDGMPASATTGGKWTNLALSSPQQALLARTFSMMARLDDYGTPELGSVTGNNAYFTLSERTRDAYGIDKKHLTSISPPGTKHLTGLTFSRGDWEELRIARQRVWLLNPDPPLRQSGLKRYIKEGQTAGVDRGYKCSIREHWWKPPVVPVPDLFFTYMSHRFPRLIANTSGATILNSMHGIRLKTGLKREAQVALPLLALNSATMAAAEMFGRSYGGGI